MFAVYAINRFCGAFLKSDVPLPQSGNLSFVFTQNICGGNGDYMKGLCAMLKASRPLGHVLALLVSIVWGTTFISTKILLRDFHPVEIMIFRFLIAWVVLFLCSPKPLKPLGFKAELPFLGAGLTGLTLYFVFENTALTTTMASTVGIIISSTPIFTALLLWLCRRMPRPKGMFFLGFLVAMAGISLISLAGGDRLDLNPAGILLTLAAAVVWGAYGVCVELSQAAGLTEIQMTRKMFFWGFVTTLPTIPVYQLDLSLGRFAAPDMLFNILYLGLLASAISFVAWNKAVMLLGSVATNVYLYLMPVITLIASAIILGEPVTLPAVGAIALIMLGLWLSQKGNTEVPIPPAEMPPTPK